MSQLEYEIKFQFNINSSQNDKQIEENNIIFVFDENNFNKIKVKSQNSGIYHQYKFKLRVDFRYEYKTFYFSYKKQNQLRVVDTEDDQKIIFTLSDGKHELIKYLQFFEKEYTFTTNSNLEFKIKGNLFFGDFQTSPYKVEISEKLKEYIKNNCCIKQSVESSPFERSQELTKYCRRVGQVKMSLKYPQFFLINGINKVTSISISADGVEINNIFAYVCYQFKLTNSDFKALPLKVLDHEKLQKSQQGNNQYEDISFNLSQDENIPVIFDNKSQFSCQHFLIFNISFHRKYCFSQHNDIDFMFPIVIEQSGQYIFNDITNEDSMKPLKSEGIIQFELDRQTKPYKFYGGHLLR